MGMSGNMVGCFDRRRHGKSTVLSLIFFVLMIPGTIVAGSVLQSDTLIRNDSGRTEGNSANTRVINQILLTGNHRTRDNIITRELTLKPGDHVASNKLDDILQEDTKKLLNTRLFNTVEIKPVTLDSSKVDLLIKVDERWYTFPIPIFELSDRNFNEWWQNYDHDIRRVNYGLRLYQYNMSGRNDKLRLTAQFGYTHRFELSYSIPYIDKAQKHGLTFDLEYAESKNLASQTIDHKLDYLETHHLLRTTGLAGVAYTIRKSFYDYHNFGFEYRTVEVSDTIQEINPNYLGEGNKRLQYSSLYYEFISDHRDFVGYPLSGQYFYVHAQQYGLTPNEVNKSEVYTGIAKFAGLGGGFYLSNFSFLYWSRQENIPYYMYGAMGYHQIFMRGFERYVIEGPRYFMNKFTIKKLVFSHTYHWEAWPIEQFRHIPLSIYFKCYGDFGYVENYPNYNLNTRLTNKLIGSTGIGVDIAGSYDFVVRVEYSLNSVGERGIFLHIRKEF